MVAERPPQSRAYDGIESRLDSPPEAKVVSRVDPAETARPLSEIPPRSGPDGKLF